MRQNLLLALGGITINPGHLAETPEQCVGFAGSVDMLGRFGPWHRLRPEQTKRATIKVIGGPVYTATEIARLHFEPKSPLLAALRRRRWGRKAENPEACAALGVPDFRRANRAVFIGGWGTANDQLKARRRGLGRGDWGAEQLA